MSQLRHASAPRARLRGFGAKTVGVGVLALVLFAQSALGGTPYVWCVPLARAQLTCCCHTHQPRVEGGPALRAPCCESRQVAKLQAGSTAIEGAFAIAPPAVASLLPLAELDTDRDASVETFRFRTSHQTRAGPAPPLFALYQRYLN